MNNKTLKKILVPLMLIAVTAALIYFITENPPESKRKKASEAPQITVKATILKPQSYQVLVQSFGTVDPRTQSVLFTQVSGQINYVNPQFRAGGFFKQGDVLIQLDDRDFRSDVNISQADLVSAQQRLAEEQARVKQAKIDWDRLGNGKEANALVLRTPQLEAAKAQMLSAEAELQQANLALERTKVIAPYSGRILQKNVDIGQVVSSNTELADIYAADYVEIRLPINNKDLPFMYLPEESAGSDSINDDSNKNTEVAISSTLIGKQTWQGNVVRTESAIDELSQQLYVVAQILSPYAKSNSQGGQIKIGQYVTAEIKGKMIEQALVIPSSAIYQGSYVYIVEDGLLKRKNIHISWQNGDESIISTGLNFGDQLVLTSLGQVNSGTRVAIEGEQKPVEQLAKKIPKERREKLEAMAKEKGISVEELIAQRQEHKAKKENN